MNSNTKKTLQLGMPFGTANGRLRKMIIFYLLVSHNENVCYRCTRRIETVEELSIEHKVPWLDNDTKLFWDLTNIAFSHLSCNIGEPRSSKTHCPQGHPYDLANTYNHPTKTNRMCRICKLISKREFRKNHPEQDSAVHRRQRGWSPKLTT